MAGKWSFSLLEKLDIIARIEKGEKQAAVWVAEPFKDCNQHDLAESTWPEMEDGGGELSSYCKRVRLLAHDKVKKALLT